MHLIRVTRRGKLNEILLITIVLPSLGINEQDSDGFFGLLGQNLRLSQAQKKVQIGRPHFIQGKQVHNYGKYTQVFIHLRKNAKFDTFLILLYETRMIFLKP